MKLTLKQKKFADEYIIGGNATEGRFRQGIVKKRRVELQRQKELYSDFSVKAGLRTKDDQYQLYEFGRSINQSEMHTVKNIDKSYLKGYNKNRKGSIALVDIQIDKVTDCLVDKSTGEEVNTAVSLITPTKKDFKDWLFDWTKPKKDGEKVYSLFVEGSDVVQGLVSMKFEYGGVFVGIVESAPHNKGLNGKYEGVGAHLFAIACKEAQDNGMDVVFFDAKTNLIPYYRKILGAEQIGSSQRMLIEGEAFENLIRIYFKKG